MQAQTLNPFPSISDFRHQQFYKNQDYFNASILLSDGNPPQSKQYLL